MMLVLTATVLYLALVAVSGLLVLNSSMEAWFASRADAIVHLLAPWTPPSNRTGPVPVRSKRVALYVVGHLRNFRESAPFWNDRLFHDKRNSHYAFDIYVCTSLVGSEAEKAHMRAEVLRVYSAPAQGRVVRAIIDTGDLAAEAARGVWPESLFHGTTCLRPTSYMFVRLKYCEHARAMAERAHGVHYDLAMYLRPDVIPDRAMKLDLFNRPSTLYFLLGTVRFRCFAEDRDYDLGYVGEPTAVRLMADTWAFHQCVSGEDLTEYVAHMRTGAGTHALAQAQVQAQTFDTVCPADEAGHCYPALNNTGALDPRLDKHGRIPAGVATKKDGTLLPQDFEGSLDLYQIPKKDLVHRAELGVWIAPFVRAFEQGVHLDTATSKRRWYFVKINRPAYYEDYGDNRLPPGECLCCKVRWLTHGAVADPYAQPKGW